MTTEDEVMKIGKKLEKMVSSGTTDHASALDLLNTLKGLSMNLQVLQKTRIGMTVNNFRKACDNEEVVTIAKGLIKNWKRLLDQGNGSKGEKKESKKDTPRRQDSDSGEVSRDSPIEKPKQTSFPNRNTDTTDSVRIKCREMLANALKLPDEVNLEGAHSPEDIAATLEDCIFLEFMQTDNKYKNRVRSRIANLKDQKNFQLKENVLLGKILPEQFAVMTAEEMASDAMKKLREKFTKEAINDHQMATQSGTQTDLLKCGKCLKRNCTYNQVQTRSADEPMTTFVYCNECGHRWKFC